MNQFLNYSSTAVPVGWQPGPGDVFAFKQGINTAMLHLVLEEDGRNPAEMLVICQANEGTLFPLVDRNRQALGLLKRFRPQPRDSISWDEVIKNFPVVDPSLLGRESWTITRWFGGKGGALEGVLSGDPAYADPRLEVLPGMPVVGNDALDVHKVNIHIGYIDQNESASSTAFGQELTKALAAVTWFTRQELTNLRKSDLLRCGFTMDILGEIYLQYPYLLG